MFLKRIAIKIQGSKLTDAKMLNACGFFHIASGSWHWNEQNVYMDISASVVQELYLAIFVLF